MIGKTRAAWVIACKDMRSYCRDRNGMLLGLLLPIALVAVFGFVQKIAFGGSGGLSKSTLWVVDEDQSERSAKMVAALKGAATIRVRPDGDDGKESAESLRAKIEAGEAHHALIIESGFEESFATEEFPDLTLICDPDRDLESQMVSLALLLSFFETAGADASSMMTARILELSGIPESWSKRAKWLADSMSESVQSLLEDADEQGVLGSENEASGPNFQNIMNELIPVQRDEIRPPERPQQLSYMLAQSVSGISVMMLMFGLVACSTLMIRERESGVLNRLLALPVTRESYLLGKFIFCAIIGVIQLTILLVFGECVFQVGMFRDPITLIILSVFLVAAVTSFGMLIAAWASTTKQAEGVSTLIILVMSALGGAWFPIQMVEIPFPATIPVKSTLTYWAMTGYQGMLWHGKPWYDKSMLLSLGVLLGFAVLAGSLAIWFFRRRYVLRVGGSGGGD